MYCIFTRWGVFCGLAKSAAAEDIEQLFDTPEQAQHAASVCAAWLGVRTMLSYPTAATAWWPTDPKSQQRSAQVQDLLIPQNHSAAAAGLLLPPPCRRQDRPAAGATVKRPSATAENQQIDHAQAVADQQCFKRGNSAVGAPPPANPA